MAKDPLGERIVLWLFLAAFFFGGLAGFYFVTVRPLWRSFRASGWSEVACTVESASARLLSHPGEDSTYEYTIRYRYAWGGLDYTSERYGVGGLESGPTDLAFRSHPKGSQATCYVDPADPRMAVMDRSQPYGWGFGIFPLLAAVLAGFVGHLGLRRAR